MFIGRERELASLNKIVIIPTSLNLSFFMDANVWEKPR